MGLRISDCFRLHMPLNKGSVLIQDFGILSRIKSNYVSFYQLVMCIYKKRHFRTFDLSENG